jgi:hypothetical protein
LSGYTAPLLLSSRHVARNSSQLREQDLSVASKVTLVNEWGTQFSLSWAQHLSQAGQDGRKNHRGLTVPADAVGGDTSAEVEYAY